MKNEKRYKKNIYAILVILLFWQIISSVLNKPIIPQPSIVLLYMIKSFFSIIFVHLLFSFGRIVFGVFISIVIGITLGIIMGYNNRYDDILSPIIYFIYPIPKVALLPVVMLFFGLGELSKIIMIILIVVFQVIVAARDAVKNIPKETYYSLYTLGASKYDILKNVLFPAALPDILTSIRVSTGTAVSVLFFIETYGTEYGMGYFIMDSWMRVNYVEMYSGIIIMGILGFLLFLMIDFFEKRFCVWK
ncbi:NitT/TauT family transport system permease protein [Caloramator quimbayensis]|uniref:NitT/TauT family transport system permease protein n=1 Tax=Caloramator quimbayensis TaxID=1147123 RepID=A0A1T4XEJ4_9CLOT|nr:ABC transporter permease [Caloramator quimbayensis]SKA87889.1 NitT/TauT family transport system permease protein [Caloramator quimbayensis]